MFLLPLVISAEEFCDWLYGPGRPWNGPGKKIKLNSTNMFAEVQKGSPVIITWFCTFSLRRNVFDRHDLRGRMWNGVRRCCIGLPVSINESIVHPIREAGGPDGHISRSWVPCYPEKHKSIANHLDEINSISKNPIYVQMDITSVPQLARQTQPSSLPCRSVSTRTLIVDVVSAAIAALEMQI